MHRPHVPREVSRAPAAEHTPPVWICSQVPRRAGLCIRRSLRAASSMWHRRLRSGLVRCHVGPWSCGPRPPATSRLCLRVDRSPCAPGSASRPPRGAGTRVPRDGTGACGRAGNTRNLPEHSISSYNAQPRQDLARPTQGSTAVLALRQPSGQGLSGGLGPHVCCSRISGPDSPEASLPLTPALVSV